MKITLIKMLQKLILLMSSSSILVAIQPPVRPFKQVVIWGHKLHTHSHSYIHCAFERAFQHLGYKTYWLDKNDPISGIDFSGSLFITEGQVDQNIPLRSDCRYILHNCDRAKYKQLFDTGNCIILQVYSHDCLKRNDEKIGPCTHMDLVNKIIYMPWATDLLPHEIDAVKKELLTLTKDKAIYMIGDISGTIHGTFENKSKHDAFKKACVQSKVKFYKPSRLSTQENKDLIQRSLIAPAIQGQWQCDNGYIPCRIFKNISYGQWGATNSKTVWELFNKKIVFNEDTYQLFFDTCKKAQQGSLDELYGQMDFVRDNHTYLNRIDTLLWFLDQIKPLQER